MLNLAALKRTVYLKKRKIPFLVELLGSENFIDNELDNDNAIFIDRDPQKVLSVPLHILSVV